MYAKIAATTSPDAPAKIVFFYNRETLFNDVSLMSNFMAKNLTTKEGNSLTDDYAMSDDERDLFGVSVQQTLPDIYEAMTKITSGVVPAFDDSVSESAGTIGKDITGVDVTIAAGDYVEFYLLDNDAYNANVITLVDASIYNALKQGTLKEFYSTIVQADFFKLCADRFLAELFKLKQRLFQLKKKSVSSNLN